MQPQQMPQNHYPKFFWMLAASFVVMYAAMYLNTYDWGDVYLNLMRFYMTCLMVLPMALIMLGFMRAMYQNPALNRLIVGGATALFVLVFFMMRNQVFVNDVRWMEGMIPHHSIALLTSKRADIRDPEARALADSIISSQQYEIAQMKRMIKRLKGE